MLTRPTLIRLALTCTLSVALIFGFGTPAQAAPFSELTTTPEGLAATLEINKLSGDLANTIPTDFATINVENAQPYASTEVDTEAEVAPTSLPMTVEEMALAEVAAVVAELTTMTGAELKAKKQAKDVAEVAEEALIRWRAEEAKRQTIEREIANAVQTLEDVTADGKDLYTATTFRANFADVIGTTTAAPTTAGPTITESPAILNDLVRAAAAANEILAAALNAATMAAPNTNDTTAAAMTDAATKTIQSEDVTNAESAAVGDGLLAMIGSETLPEAKFIWRPTEVETTNIAKSTTTLQNDVEGVGTTTPITAIITDITQSETTPNANISNKINSANLLVDSVESAKPEASLANEQKLITTVIQETSSTSTITATPATKGATEISKVDEVLEKLTNTATIPLVNSAQLLEQFKETARSEEANQLLGPVDSETAESKKIVVTEASDNNEVENGVTYSRSTDAAATERYESLKTTTEAENESKTTLKDTGFGSLPSEEPLVENVIKVAGFEIAKVEEVKPEIRNRENNEERAIASEIKKTTTLEIEDLSQTTTESLETLIAVESEARAPNQVISPAPEVEVEVRATTPAIPDVITTIEAKTDQSPTDTKTTTAASITIAPEQGFTTTTTELPDPNTKSKITSTAANEAILENNAAIAENEKESEATLQPTAESTTVKEDATAGVTDETKILLTTTTREVTAEEPLTKAERITKDEGAETTETTTTTREEQSPEITLSTIESASYSIGVPLAEFTTTAAGTEEVLREESFTKTAHFEESSASESTEKVQLQQHTTDTTTPAADPIIPTTLSSTATTSVPAAADSQTKSALESDRVNLDTPAPTTITPLESAPLTTTTEQTEPEVAILITTEADIEEQPLYTRVLNASQHQHAISENRRKIETTSLRPEAAETTEIATTTAEVRPTTEATTTAVVAEISSTTPEPESKATTTTITTSTTTTTTTLSPMSLIIAEHEARSLQRTAPRVSRIVSDDGVEVLSGYSIVHQMHAAALAALTAHEATEA